MTPATTRRATYRLQLGGALDLHAAAGLVDYLAALGVSHLYLSPVAQAAPGTTHGYDVVDPTRVSAELGGDAAFGRLAAAARAAGLALLVDIVPNHLAAHPENRHWWSLLRDGREGAGARWFDVEWDAPRADGRVVLPVLAGPLADELAAGAIVLVRDGPEPVLRYHEHVLPVAPGSLDDGPDLPTLLARQHHRPVHWRDADAPNYRRFFDVDGLAGVRIEDPVVFDEMHRLVARWVAEGTVDGVRVDHVDGLRDPAGYLHRLRDLVGPDRWVLVEKILEPGEELPPSWPVAGTTGYDVAEHVDPVLVDPAGEGPLTALWVDRTADARDWAATAAEARALVVERLFPAEVGRVARAVAVAAGPEAGRPEVLRPLLVAFTGYRTYVGPDGAASAADRARIADAVAGARLAPGDAPGADRLVRVLTGDEPGPAATEARLRFQQLTGPVAAKGVEDTAMYRYVRLASRAEVGADPGTFARPTDELHAALATIATRRPETMVATSTHDTKRSADVRARLHVLAEIPDEWAAAVTRWSDRAAALGAAIPEPRLELLAWQTLVGAWPLDAPRLRGYLRKAAREAKTATSWRAPDERFEAALDRFVDVVLADDVLAGDLAGFVDRVLVAGRVNSLAQTLVTLTAPGVPDTYRGSELWDLALVDPDNRRPVDWELRRALLGELRGGPAPVAALAAALADPDDPGRPKLWTLHRALALRAQRPASFGPGAAYAPLVADGPAAGHVVAFARGDDVAVVVPRLPLGLDGRWAGTTLPLPGGRWRDLLSDAEHEVGPGATPGAAPAPVPLADLLARFPVALLARVRRYAPQSVL